MTTTKRGGYRPSREIKHSKLLAERYGLAIVSTEVHANPTMSGDMGAGATHWSVKLTNTADPAGYGKTPRAMTLFFSQGSAHTGKPSLYSVLSCLASDAGMWESGEFESFTEYYGAFGYDEDSRSAEHEYNRCRDAIERQTSDLRALLGNELLAALLEDEDVQ